MVKIKKNVYIHPTAIVEEGAEIGEGTKIWHHVHVRKGAKIGKNCILGKDVYIDQDVVIGNGVKLQNRVSVYHGVTIEDDVFVGPHATFTNDMYPRALNKEWKGVKTLVKKGASIGAGAVIVCDTVIGEYAMVGAGAVVTKDVPPFGLVLGVPAKLKGFVCYCGFPLKKKISEDENTVTLKCEQPNCGKEVKIPKELYYQVHKNREG